MEKKDCEKTGAAKLGCDTDTKEAAKNGRDSNTKGAAKNGRDSNAEAPCTAATGTQATAKPLLTTKGGGEAGQQRGHALLSPSAAHRWLHCTAAPRLEQYAPDTGSTFAEEGTLAHAYCAKKLKEVLGQATESEDREIAELAAAYHTGEMDEYTETYRTIVLEKWNEARAKTRDAQLLVEVKLDFGEWMPEAFGTADAVIIADDMMEVIDFKYGKGVKVDSEENPQMKIYALGAWQRFSFEYNIRRVRMTIVQPRIDNLSEWELSVTELLAWAKYELRPKAKEAFGPKGRQEPGEWCRFCKVKAVCRALADQTFAAVEEHPDPATISPEDMAKVILPMLETVKTWLKGVEEYTLEQALQGVTYEGWKLVAGRSVRKITDQGAVIDALQAADYAEETYLKPRELKTITELEKLLGKKTFGALCGEWIDKPLGKPTLVPESDKRAPLSGDDLAGMTLSE